MHSWIMQKGYPVVYVERDYHAGEAKIWQETYRLNLLDNIRTEKWCIPITFTTESELNFFRLTPRIWLKPNMSNIKLSNIDKDEWIIINLRQSGKNRSIRCSMSALRVSYLLEEIEYQIEVERSRD